MSGKKEKAKRKTLDVQAADAVCGALDELDKVLAPVTAKEMAQAHERVRLCERVFTQTRAQAQKVVQDTEVKLQAARNDLDKLAARVRTEEAEGKKDGGPARS